MLFGWEGHECPVGRHHEVDPLALEIHPPALRRIRLAITLITGQPVAGVNMGQEVMVLQFRPSADLEMQMRSHRVAELPTFPST